MWGKIAIPGERDRPHQSREVGQRQRPGQPPATQKLKHPISVRFNKVNFCVVLVQLFFWGASAGQGFVKQFLTTFNPRLAF